MSLQFTTEARQGQPRPDRSTRRPYAQLPHDIAADPRLTPTDVSILLALLFFARDKPTCWPCDRTIGGRVGRSRATVQRRLKHLEACGLVSREKCEANATGRLLRLLWRVTRETPPVASSRPTPVSPVRHELSNKQEKENAVTIALSGEPAGETKAGEDKLIADMTADERNALFAGLSWPGLTIGRPTGRNVTAGLSGDGVPGRVKGWRPS